MAYSPLVSTSCPNVSGEVRDHSWADNIWHYLDSRSGYLVLYATGSNAIVLRFKLLIITLVGCHLLACVQVPYAMLSLSMPPLRLSLCARSFCWLTARCFTKRRGSHSVA